MLLQSAHYFWMYCEATAWFVLSYSSYVRKARQTEFRHHIDCIGRSE